MIDLTPYHLVFSLDFSFVLGRSSWKSTGLPPGLGWRLRIWGSSPEYFAAFFFSILGGFYLNLLTLRCPAETTSYIDKNLKLPTYFDLQSSFL